MFDGSTSGRAFESQFGFYLFCAIVVVTVILWIWFHFDLRKWDARHRSDDTRDD